MNEMEKPAAGGRRAPPSRFLKAWRSFKQWLRAQYRAAMAVLLPGIAGLVFLGIDMVRGMAQSEGCRVWSSAGGGAPAPALEGPLLGPALHAAVALTDGLRQLVLASCAHGRGVELVLLALWWTSLALFVLGLATLVLRHWPRELKQWVDKFAQMIVDAFASGLGETGRARAHAAATVLTYTLAIAVPALAAASVPPTQDEPTSGPSTETPPPPPSQDAVGDEIVAHLARIEARLQNGVAPPVNVHVSGQAPRTPDSLGALLNTLVARDRASDAAEIRLTALHDSLRQLSDRMEGIDGRIRTIETEDRRFASLLVQMTEAGKTDRARLAQEQKSLLARWRDSWCGRDQPCFARRHPAPPPPPENRDAESLRIAAQGRPGGEAEQRQSTSRPSEEVPKAP